MCPVGRYNLALPEPKTKVMKHAWACAVTAALLLLLGAPQAARAQAAPGIDHAKALFDKGDYKGAVAILNDVLAKDPKNARALVVRGDAQDNLGNPQAALTDYNAAIAVNPNYEYAYATRCTTENELDRYRDAVDDCTKALTLVNDDDYALRGRSFAYFMLDDYELASADAEKAIAIDGTNPYNMLARCRANVWLNRLKIAMPACSTYIADKPQDASGYFYRGRGEMIAGDNAASRTDFQKTLHLDDTYTSADYWLTFLELQDKHYPDSVAAATVFLKKYPDTPEILLARGTAELALGNKAAAKDDAAQALHYAQIQNDSDQMKAAQTLLDAISKA